jgi:four helix bundle protein
LGKQLTEAADSVGFNLVEGDGRYSDAEAIHFFHISRGSARETKLGIERSRARGLMPDETALEMIREIDEASKQLNGLISYRKRTKAARVVREVVAAYDSDSSGLNA